MKILVVYYSRSGRSRIIAEAIAQKLKADLQEIIPLKGYKGLFGFIRGGYQATRKKNPAIQPLGRDLAAYDLIIFGTPIWGSRMSSPLRTLITEQKSKIRKYAFFCTAGSSEQQSAVDELRELIGSAPTAIMTLTSHEVTQGRFQEKLDAFTAGIPAS